MAVSLASTTRLSLVSSSWMMLWFVFFSDFEAVYVDVLPLGMGLILFPGLFAGTRLHRVRLLAHVEL